MLSWREEMDNMLGIFDRQARISLKNIRMAFRRSSLSFDSEFKQYFLQASSDRIKTTYEEFEFFSMNEECTEFGANAITFDGSQMLRPAYTAGLGRKEDGRQMIDSVEIIDSDEECTSKAPGMLKIASVESLVDNLAIHRLITDTIMNFPPRQHGGNNTSAANYGENRIGSSVIRRRTINSNDGNRYNRHSNFADTTEDRSIKPTTVESQYAILNDVNGKNHAQVRKAVVNKRSLAVTSNNQNLNVVRRTERNPEVLDIENCHQTNNMAGPSNIRPKAASHPIQNSTLSKQLVTKKRFACHRCEYSSNFKQVLNTHMRTHASYKPYRCDICYKEFNKLHNMKRHKVTHTEQIPFHCQGCFSGFTKKTAKNAHEKVCQIRRYECHVCKKFVTVGITLLKRHMRKHNGEKPFECKICMKHFTTKGSLKRHLNTIHKRTKTKNLKNQYQF